MDAVPINMSPSVLCLDAHRERDPAVLDSRSARPDSRRSAPTATAASVRPGTPRAVAGSDAATLTTSTSPKPPTSPTDTVSATSLSVLPRPARPPPPALSTPAAPAAFFATRAAKSAAPPDRAASGTGSLPVRARQAFPSFLYGLRSSRNNTVSETSLVGARGKSIPLGSGSVADRTSALRELNNHFPSPVLRHGSAKSTAPANTTYSQPVIVRTYSGPSASPSASTHNRRRTSSNRAVRPVNTSLRIPLPSPPAPVPALVPAPAFPRPRVAASTSSRYAPKTADGLNASFFSMARSKVKRGLIPWSWVTGDTDRREDEAKLPPLEAFTYKGFMADLQSTTSIRSDLDRIAEICARSRYSLSNQYDSHVAPHGSGAGFASGSGQNPQYRSKGRKKATSSPGGLTLQAVTSDDDESSARGHLRRRGGGRKRSRAQGRLETIMSSSRSSEEEKSKKKSAAAIQEEVRGRARKVPDPTAANAATSGKAAGALDVADAAMLSGSRSGSTSPRDKDRKSATASDEPRPAGALAQETATQSAAPSQSGRLARHRPKPTSFAHAMIDNNRHTHSQSSKASKRAVSDVAGPLPTPATLALLSEPALPQTSNEVLEVHTPSDPGTASGAAKPHKNDKKQPAKSRIVVGLRLSESDVMEQHKSRIRANKTPDRGAEIEASVSLQPSLAPLDDAATAGFLSGFSSLGNWVPWVATGVASESHATAWLDQTIARPCPSHAEGSLRELLKATAAGKPNKGKAVDYQS